MTRTSPEKLRSANSARGNPSKLRRAKSWRVCDTPNHGRLESKNGSKPERASANDCQCLATLGYFAANVIHDVNNPLGTALSSVQLALRLAQTNGSTQLVAALKRSAVSIRQASQLIARLSLLTADGSSGEVNCCPRDVAHAAKSVMAQYAKCHDCSLRLRCSSGDARACGDAVQLTLALVNLMADAIERGATAICVASKMTPSSIAVEIQDNSTHAAIHSERVGSLSVTSNRVDSVVHSIVQRHSGRLEAKQRRSGGRTMSLILPLRSR